MSRFESVRRRLPAKPVVTEPSEMAEVVRLLKAKYWLARPYLWLKKRPDGVFRVQFTS
jgi:hypothetical protein